MKGNNFNKILLSLIVGFIIGFFLAIYFTNGLYSNENSKKDNPRDEFIDLSVSIDDLKDLIILHSSCELGEKISCDNLNKVIKNSKDYKNLWVTTTGQVRKL